MEVIFIPNWSKGNPYQSLLAYHLAKKGVKVIYGISSYRNFLSLKQCIENQGHPDILHIHWQHPFLVGWSNKRTILQSVSFLMELIFLKVSGIKIVWTVHNIVNHEEKYKSLELFFSKFLAKISDRLIVHSSSIRDIVAKVYKIDKNLIRIIPHGHYISCYENNIRKPEARKLLQIPIENKVFLYFGQIRPYKGISDLIDSFIDLHDSMAYLLIVGKPYNNELIEEIENKTNKYENIKAILRFIPDHEIQIYMNAADVVVFPFKKILTSGSVILAMSFAKPIIAPTSGCIPDILDNKGSFLYNPLSENSLLEAMKALLNFNDDNLRKMGEHNFKLAKQLRWDIVAEKTYKVYRESLQ